MAAVLEELVKECNRLVEYMIKYGQASYRFNTQGMDRIPNDNDVRMAELEDADLITIEKEYSRNCRNMSLVYRLTDAGKDVVKRIRGVRPA